MGGGVDKNPLKLMMPTSSSSAFDVDRYKVVVIAS